jgi:hypothetical protein
MRLLVRTSLQISYKRIFIIKFLKLLSLKAIYLRKLIKQPKLWLKNVYYLKYFKEI